MSIHELREAQARFEPMIPEIEKERSSLYRLRTTFTRYFNDRGLQRMGIDDYVIGVGAPNKGYNFCYTLERQLDGLGRIIGATASKFGVYYGKKGSDKTDEYRFTNKWGDNYSDAYDAIKLSIQNLINAGHSLDLTAIADNGLSPMFKGKILATYFPDRYLNIFSERHLNFFLRQLSIDTKDLINGDPVYKREALLVFKEADPVMKNWSIDMFSHFLYNEYPGRPPYDENASAVLSTLLEDYRLPEFADNPDPEFINMSILPIESKEGNARSRRNIANKRDYEKEARKLKRLGDRGEKIVKDMEVKRLQEAGRGDLAEMVTHVSLESDAYGYDILSYEIDESPRYIEVKATTESVGNANFYFTKNELRAAHEEENFFLYIVYDVTSLSPKIWPIKNPFNPENANVLMIPVNYKVTINARL